MKAILFITAIFLCSINTFSQKQRFDVVSYTTPKGWEQQQNEGGVQLSATDKKNGAYAMIIITKAKSSNASADENFTADWTKLVKGAVQVNAEPTMLNPEKEKGWDIISGIAEYTDGTQNGKVTLMTATGGGQMASVVLLTNTDKYEKELLAFLHSVELTKASQNDASGTTVAKGQTLNSSSIAGLWVSYVIETSGYSNGFPQPSGGYFRKEYAFYDDGTYLFRLKNWGVFVKEIQFVYESGTWKLSGNKLSITPRQGKGGWWSKSKNNRTNEWGSLVRSGSWKLEPVTYTIELHYYAGVNETHLVLQSGSQTEREGKQENNKQSYAPRSMGKSLIDNPPGIKTGFENKAATSPSSSRTKTGN